MSESLIWHLIRDNNSFLVKRGNTRRDGSVQFSKEPGNLLNVNTFKYSGIANQRTIDLSVAGGERPYVVLKQKVSLLLFHLEKNEIFSDVLLRKIKRGATL
jgi:large subunit ribosomal protein L28e